VFFSKIASNFRIESDDTGGVLKFSLTPTAGGHTTKVAMYQVVVVQKSSTNMQVSADLDHGPDGRTFVNHSTPIGTTQLTGSNANLLSGQADTAKVIGEWLRITLSASGATSAKHWAIVDVYEMRKPF
jgi:hypothetical protein